MAVLHKEQLGKVIRARRDELGLSQKDLAALCHVKEPQTVSRWERGENEPGDLGAVAAALQFSSVADMLGGIAMPERDRRRQDPEGQTQLDRIEAALARLQDGQEALAAASAVTAEGVAEIRRGLDPPAQRRAS